MLWSITIKILLHFMKFASVQPDTAWKLQAWINFSIKLYFLKTFFWWTQLPCKPFIIKSEQLYKSIKTMCLQNYVINNIFHGRVNLKQQQTICSASAAALASMANARASPLILIASASASASKVILFLSAAAIVSNLRKIC